MTRARATWACGLLIAALAGPQLSCMETMMTAAAATSPACRAIATPLADTSGGAALYALRFELTIPGPAAVELSYDQPFMAFTLEAVAKDGRPVAVLEPAWQVASRKATLHLPPGRPTTLATPATLRIGPGATPGAQGFERVVAAEKDAVELHARLHLPAPFEAGCSVEFE